MEVDDGVDKKKELKELQFSNYLPRSKDLKKRTLTLHTYKLLKASSNTVCTLRELLHTKVLVFLLTGTNIIVFLL